MYACGCACVRTTYIHVCACVVSVAGLKPVRSSKSCPGQPGLQNSCSKFYTGFLALIVYSGLLDGVNPH